MEEKEAVAILGQLIHLLSSSYIALPVLQDNSKALESLWWTLQLTLLFTVHIVHCSQKIGPLRKQLYFLQKANKHVCPMFSIIS
jgi:hypothetical protein